MSPYLSFSPSPSLTLPFSSPLSRKRGAYKVFTGSIVWWKKGQCEHDCCSNSKRPELSFRSSEAFRSQSPESSERPIRVRSGAVTVIGAGAVRRDVKYESTKHVDSILKVFFPVGDTSTAWIPGAIKIDRQRSALPEFSY
jgi:hypothetical protein